MNKTNDNICFFLEEKVDDTRAREVNYSEIQTMMKELTEDFVSDYNSIDEYENEYKDVEDGQINNLEYFFKKDVYNNDELYYDQECSVKELLKICKYYGIDKDIKSLKCKKNDIINTIIFFEILPENSEIVKKRHRMWAYITELIKDPKMKQYILWN
jgi:hypothetical protein